jgi:3-dehydroquinate synthase
MYNNLTVKSSIKNYTISFNQNLDNIKKIINELDTLTILDSNIKKLYPELSTKNNIVIECNENAKTLDGVNTFLQTLINKKANTKTKLVVIGGGILQDLIGFCASIYCRGIDYILIPTTLLAQTDSCVGGKTSINFFNKKNILGTFYPPKEIIICPLFLKTLSNVDFLSGLGEIYKFHILQNKIDHFNSSNEITKMIYKGLQYKIDILSRDEFDKGERKFLNYGHTFGHALESTSNYNLPHGLAIVIGCLISTRIAIKLNYTVSNSVSIFKKGIKLIQDSSIPIQKGWFNSEALLTAAKSDKKSTGELTMVLVDNKPFLENIKDVTIMDDIFKEVYESI